MLQRLICAFLFYLLSAVNLQAQTDLQTEMNPQLDWEILHYKKFKIASCTIYSKVSYDKEYKSDFREYNEQGRILSSKHFDYNGTVTSDKSYSYDKKGQLTHLKTEKLDLNFTYSKKGIKEISGTHEGKPVQWNGANRTLVILYYNLLKKTEYTFNEAGLVVKLDEQDQGDDNQDLLITYTYDATGHLLSLERKEMGESSDHSYVKRTSTYNASGLLTEEKHDMRNDYTAYDETIEYTYEDNKLTQVKHKNDAYFARTFYEYTAGLNTGFKYYQIITDTTGQVREELYETQRFDYAYH